MCLRYGATFRKKMKKSFGPHRDLICDMGKLATHIEYHNQVVGRLHEHLLHDAADRK